MSCEKSLGFLLELLWAYFFSTNSFRDDHWTASNFSKSLGKNLCVDNVPLDNLDVIVWSECFVKLARVYILSSPNQQSIFIKGEFDDTDAVGFSYSSHKVTESGVKRTPSTRCNQIGRMPSSNDLFDKDPIGFWNLEGIDCMFFQMSSNSIRNCIWETVCFPQDKTWVLFTSQWNHAMTYQRKQRGRQFPASWTRFAWPWWDRWSISSDTRYIDTGALNICDTICWTT